MPERLPSSKGGTLKLLGDKKPFACNNCPGKAAKARIDWINFLRLNIT
ncbi:hypothetical protein MNB_SUP05-6-422 [hydrothermal vent metagenome]|uniref:Uncharacterized protein n=1 Tax=hydrothermal vent metagenome TaxID=652676 RepID=A0A1W1DLQ5_9ZZZZ